MNILEHELPTAVVAEWLRRLTRNQLGSARAGSNPADCVTFLLHISPQVDSESNSQMYKSILFHFVPCHKHQYSFK